MSNTVYTPDRWVMLKITSKTHGVVYKVLGSWYGGFGGSNSWKLSSGSKEGIINNTTGVLSFPQWSGSSYIGTWNNYGMSAYTASILCGWQRELEGTDSTMEVMEENFDIALVTLK